jgi:tRNA(Leu) C34 or U34 (ribose-2'-O)-methylase TrmL
MCLGIYMYRHTKTTTTTTTTIYETRGHRSEREQGRIYVFGEERKGLHYVIKF